MDKHIADDPNNPINWKGESPTCSCCEEILSWWYDDFDDEICKECFEKEQDYIGEAENLKE